MRGSRVSAFIQQNLVSPETTRCIPLGAHHWLPWSFWTRRADVSGSISPISRISNLRANPPLTRYWQYRIIHWKCHHLPCRYRSESLLWNATSFLSGRRHDINSLTSLLFSSGRDQDFRSNWSTRTMCRIHRSQELVRVWIRRFPPPSVQLQHWRESDGDRSPPGLHQVFGSTSYSTSSLDRFRRYDDQIMGLGKRLEVYSSQFTPLFPPRWMFCELMKEERNGFV